MKTLFKKHPVVIVVGAAVILAIAVFVTSKLTNPAPPVDPETEIQTTEGTATQEAEATKRTSQAITKHGVTTKHGVSEQTLRALLRNEIDGEDEILSFDYLDYDGDSTSEAFAFAGKKTGDEDGGPAYLGELWFVNEDGAEMVVSREETNGFWNVNQTYTFGKHSIVVLSKFFQTGDRALVWTVKDGKPCEETNLSNKGSEFTSLGGNDVVIVDDTYDFGFDGTGHTYKPYWFYWDEAASSFKEYGGKQLEYEQFLKCKGAQRVLNAIDAADCAVREIYYRANGIININYVDYEGESNHNASLRLKGNTVALQGFWSEYGFVGTDLDILEDSNHGGVYAAALIPDIAVYPAKLPAVFG